MICNTPYTMSNVITSTLLLTLAHACAAKCCCSSSVCLSTMCMYMWRGFESHLRRIFSRKSEPWVCCVALPCLFVCLCLLLSFFLLSSLIKTCMYLSICWYIFSLTVAVWWIPNVDMWVCAVGAQHSRSVERRC